MDRVSAVPYYSSGALLGLVLGYAYIWLQIIQILPGLGWLADAIRAVLPKKKLVGSVYADPFVQASPESFAVLDASSLGSALCQMSVASEGPATPHPSFQDQDSTYYNAVPAIAVATTGRTHANMRNSTSNDIIPAEASAAAGAFAAAAAAAAAPTPVDQEQLLICLRQRLSSFPVDNLSPATTATALSLLTGGLAPGGNLAYNDEDDEPSPYIDMAVGPVEPVEGELDLIYTHSNSNNLLPLLPPSSEASTSPAAPAGPDEPGAAAAAGSEPVLVLSLPERKFPRLAAVGSTAATSPVDAARSSSRHTGPPGTGVTSSPSQRNAGPNRHSRSDTVPLTDRAIQELNRQTEAASGEEYRNAVGSPRAAYAVGRPAQRAILITQRSRTSSLNSNSSNSSPCKVPVYQQQQQQQMEKSGLEGSTAAAAGGSAGPGALGPARALNLAFSATDDGPGAGPATAAATASAAGPSVITAATAAAKGDLAGADAASDGPPEQPATPRSMSSIHTTDSAATVERKKRLGGRLFAALKQKAVKGRQQVR